MKILKGATALAILSAVPGLALGSAWAADQDQPKPIVKKAKPIIDVPFFSYVDNRLTYAHVFHAIDAGYYSPKAGGGYNGSFDQDVIAFTHFDTWAYGTNFFTISVSKSGKLDAAAPCTNAGEITTAGGTVAANCAGATTVYGVLRSTFGFNEIFDTKAFSWGPLRNVSLEVGADAGAQNTYFAAAPFKGFIGLQFAFDLPYQGYINIAPMYKLPENTHNGYSQCGNVFARPAPFCNDDGNMRFPGTWAVETNYSMDLGFLPESIRYFSVSGRAGFYGPKGPFQGIAGQESTKIEINTEPVRLTFDAGRAFLGKRYAHEIDYWVAYRYWKNQYGDDANSSPFVCTVNGISTKSCTASSAATGVTVKF
jgi:hypothetical protein